MIRIGDFVPEQRHIDAVVEVMKSGRLTEGPKVKALERFMEDYLGVKHAILVTNGTVALQLVSLYIQHKKKLDTLKVTVPALTFPATINAFLVGNHNVSLCDVNNDLQINIDDMTTKQKEYTDVIVPVHLMGYTADMDSIMEQAKRYNWTVVEDACESFGADYKGRKAGTIGHFGCFSFYVSHNIIAGEMGMVVTNDDEAAEVLRSMKNHGRAGSNLLFLHKYVGSNYKTTEFNASIALENMKTADEILSTRLENARFFFENVKNEKLTLYPITEGFSPLGYPIGCPSEEYKDYMCKKLNDNDIETRGIFPCLSNQEAYEYYFTSDYPVAEKLEKTVFYVGVHQYLSEEDKQKIVEVLSE